MSEFVKIIEGIELDVLKPPNYLLGIDNEKYISSIVRIREILKLLLNTAAILDSNEIPLYLVNMYATLLNEFKAAHVDGFTKTIEATPDALNYYRGAMNNLENYHNRFFEMSASNYNLLLINSIDNYKFQDTVQIELRADKAVEEVEETVKRFDRITEKLEKESTKKVLSNYASIFAGQEKSHKNASKNWLITSVISSIVFLFLFTFSIIWEWFPNKISLKDTRNGQTYTNEVFNLPLLVSKIVIISFILFLISFCFRQYSINKNLQVINEQRKNAIESYDLFGASVGRDSAMKNVLLMQLAKSIYQMTQTGFLSGKQPDMSNSQLLELTRVFHDNEK
jgi:hypothetical protein